MPAHKRWRKRLMIFLFVAFVSILGMELMSRAFWHHYGTPFFDPGRVLYAYYPEIVKVDRDRPTRGNGSYNILLLGGSVINDEWSTVEKELGAQLASLGHGNVRIYNLAKPGHSSRDSLLKYSALDTSSFDLVVFYHGINDVRANNAPPEIFKADYSHYIWYEMINSMARYHGSALFALPYTLRYIAISISQRLNQDRYIPLSLSSVRQDWVKYGSTIRSAESFRQNLNAIVNMASTRGDRIMIVSFATCVLGNYAPESYEWPLERWGLRENVLAGVFAHNRILKDLAAHRKEVLFTDMDALMSDDARYFIDPCHLSAAGSKKFVENLLAVLLSNNKNGY